MSIEVSKFYWDRCAPVKGNARLVILAQADYHLLAYQRSLAGAKGEQIGSPFGAEKGELTGSPFIVDKGEQIGSPFGAEKGEPMDRKGEQIDTKGERASSPDPYRSIKDPNTTADAVAPRRHLANTGRWSQPTTTSSGRSRPSPRRRLRLTAAGAPGTSM